MSAKASSPRNQVVAACPHEFATGPHIFRVCWRPGFCFGIHWWMQSFLNAAGEGHIYLDGYFRGQFYPHEHGRCISR